MNNLVCKEVKDNVPCMQKKSMVDNTTMENNVPSGRLR